MWKIKGGPWHFEIIIFHTWLKDCCPKCPKIKNSEVSVQSALRFCYYKWFCGLRCPHRLPWEIASPIISESEILLYFLDFLLEENESERKVHTMILRKILGFRKYKNLGKLEVNRGGRGWQCHCAPSIQWMSLNKNLLKRIHATFDTCIAYLYALTIIFGAIFRNFTEEKVIFRCFCVK